MSKYTVEDSFKIRTDKKKVNLKILFVPTIDCIGTQYYLCERYENDGLYIDLNEENELDKYYIKINS